MRTSIILILTVGLTATLTSGQSGWPSGQFPSSQYSQYQPYRAPSAPSAPSTLSIPSSGQYQSSPQLQTLSQLSGYNRLAAPSVQSSPWSPSSAGQSGNRGWSIPSPARAYASLPQPASAGYSAYARPVTMTAPASAPTAGNPFQTSFSIQHSSAAPQQPASLSLPAPQLQTYRAPSPVAAPPVQSWSPPAAPAQSWSPPAAPAQSWSPPSAPAQSWSPPAAPAQTWRAPAPVAPAPTQSWSAPAPATQWRPAPAPAQTYTAPRPAPVQAAPQPPPQSVSSYQSPQNSQNLRPAPVHYASIGADLQGDYKFGYHTGDGGSFREETRLPDGTVQGAYGFIDADGKQRIVRYRAGKEGFQAEGDDVPKGAPAGAPAGAGSAPTQPTQPASAPIQMEEGAAFRSFAQG